MSLMKGTFHTDGLINTFLQTQELRNQGIKRAIPTRRFWQDRRYNWPAMADYSADYSDPVGMAY